MDPRILLFAVCGGLVGLAADRLAARWPSQRWRTSPTEERPVRRGLDWRTPTLVGVGALAFGALAARWAEPRDMVILVAWFAALMVLLATDLDRRHLPDLLTLPLMPIALLLVVAGFDPLLEGSELGLVSAIAAGIGAPIVLAASSRLLRGGIGAGDLKLAVGLGLVSGASRLGAGVVLALAASSIVLMVLLVTRRLSRNSVIPFGPVVIAGGFLAALLG